MQFTSNSVLVWRSKLAWAHDTVTDPTITTAFQAIPAAGFTIFGATPARDSLLSSTGAELRFVNGVSVSGKFDSEFAQHSTTVAGTGTVRVRW